jgi:ferrous iron transport protein A
MRENLIRMCIGAQPRRCDDMSPLSTRSLHQLADGSRATVARVVSASSEIDAVALRRLGELGFLPGEPVQLLRRGPGGREPLAVMVGETMFALRLLEAQCIEVEGVQPAAASDGPSAR